MTIAALTLVAVLLVTVGFYPQSITNFVLKLFPWAPFIKPWMLKLILYFGVQVTVVGVGIRAFGRFGNPELLSAWRQGKICAIFVGQLDKRPS